MATQVAANLIAWPEFHTSTQQPTIAKWCFPNSQNTSTALKRIQDAESAYLNKQYPRAEDKAYALGRVTDGATAGPYVAYFDVDLGATAAVATCGFKSKLTHAMPSPGGRGRELIVVSFDLADDIVPGLNAFFGFHVASAAADVKLYGVRLERGAPPDTLGVFSGAMGPTPEHEYAWQGAEYDSNSLALAVEPVPPVPPGPTNAIVDRVLTLLMQDKEDSDVLAQASESVEAITMMVYSYTRGNGFSAGEDGEDVPERRLAAVITTAATRYMANPSGLTYRAGTEAVTDAFKGWTMAETFVLNSYRKRQS